MAPPRALLFDLDGTLIDTAPEIADALNATLAALGLPAVPEAAARGWIGDGARVLLARACAHVGAPGPATERVAERVADLVAEGWPVFQRAYFERLGTRSVLFPGARACLERCRARGTRTAVLTNKEGRFARELLRHHGLDALLDAVVAGDTLPVKKPDPAVVHHALALLDVRVGEDADVGGVALVGDSLTDVRAARAAGIAAWIVGHGYPQGRFDGADRPDRWIDGFDRL